MRKKLSCLLLSGALALSLAACAPAEEEPSPSPLPSAPPPESSVQVLATPTPEPTASPETTADFDLPDRDYQPWQVGYMEFLAALLQAEQDTREVETAYAGLAVDERGVCCFDAGEKLRMTQVMAMGSECYSLHDVDRDGVPELFVKYGDCEAAFTYQCYAWRDGQVVCIGEFYGGHSSLYAHPDKSTVLRNYGQMGCAAMYEYPMEGGVLTEEREMFSEEDVREYTPIEEIVPGARYMEYYYTPGGSRDNSFFTGRTPYALGSALVLPICDYYDGPAATGHSTETILVLSEQGGTVYAYYFGHYFQSTFCEDGTILDDYGKTCRLSFWKGQCYEYAVPDTSAPAVKWVDGVPAG